MWKRPSCQAVEEAERGGTASAQKAQSPAINPADKRRDVPLMFAPNRFPRTCCRGYSAGVREFHGRQPTAARSVRLRYSPAVSVDIEGGASSGALPPVRIGDWPHLQGQHPSVGNIAVSKPRLVQRSSVQLSRLYGFVLRRNVVRNDGELPAIPHADRRLRKNRTSNFVATVVDRIELA